MIIDPAKKYAGHRIRCFVLCSPLGTNLTNSNPEAPSELLVRMIGRTFYLPLPGRNLELMDCGDIYSHNFNYLIINKLHIKPEFTLVHHSASIEGSTLTEIETGLLLSENIVPKGKPLIHSLMVKDHYEALLFVLESAAAKKSITTEFIQQINARVMKNTGGLYNTVFGEIDGTKGMFRKGNVSAGGSYFLNYDKVAPYTAKLAKQLDEHLSSVRGQDEQLKLSFAAHYDLVSIHPFYDGNGRTSRLLMNYIQAYHELPLAIVFKEDKQEYYTALQETRKQEDMQVFYTFMFEQYMKHLEQETTS